MSRYELLVFLHITAAIIWLGSGFLIALLLFGAERAGDRERQFGYYRDLGWLSPRLFIPASLATFVLGILVAVDGDWGFDHLWIIVGLAGYLFSFLIGILFFKPESEKIAALAEQHGLDYPELTERTERMGALERFQLLVLFLVVADMVIKPTGDDTGVLIVGALLLLAGAAAVAVSQRRAA